MGVFLILGVLCVVGFFIYRIWDEIPELSMALKEQNRELVKIREFLEKQSESRS